MSEAHSSQALAHFFAASGVSMSQVPVLQPAEPYLDTAGEALRRRIFLTRGEGGRSLCLRPDFTIPVAIAHIERGQSLPRRYAYDGLVFRQDRDGPAEFRQAGIEDLGTSDTAAADAAAIADAARALEACGLQPSGFETVMGDQALFEAFLHALGLPAGWQRRLIRTFGNDRAMGAALESLAHGPARDALAGLPDHLVKLARAGDEAALAGEVGELMEEAGLPPHRGRTPAEVATRMVEKVAIAEARLPDTLLERLRRFLAIDCPLAEAEAVLASLDAGLGQSLERFAERRAALERTGLDLTRLRYRAAFGRPLDYYTGMVFEMTRTRSDAVLAGGGRYDRLVSFLGARAPIPAVGFALWLDRIQAARSDRP